MMRTTMLTALCVVACLAVPVLGAERHPMQSRVPVDKLVEARALKSPFSNSSAVIEQGKAVYHGKGTCFTCHGTDGDGNGPAAATLNPLPRNFQHHGFWRHRTEGELFWVIKHGSPGTAMIGFGQILNDEEIWAVIHYVRTFGGRHGPGMRGQKGNRGHDGMDGMGHRGRRDGGDGMNECEGEACAR